MGLMHSDCENTEERNLMKWFSKLKEAILSPSASYHRGSVGTTSQKPRYTPKPSYHRGGVGTTSQKPQYAPDPSYSRGGVGTTSQKPSRGCPVVPKSHTGRQPEDKTKSSNLPRETATIHVSGAASHNQQNTSPNTINIHITFN